VIVILYLVYNIELCLRLLKRPGRGKYVYHFLNFILLTVFITVFGYRQISFAAYFLYEINFACCLPSVAYLFIRQEMLPFSIIAVISHLIYLEILLIKLNQVEHYCMHDKLHPNSIGMRESCTPQHLLEEITWGYFSRK
jgi:hypothetical protein